MSSQFVPASIPDDVLVQLAAMGDAALAALGPAHETFTHDKRGPYLEKWRLAQGPDGSATLIHRFLRSDGDNELHDHPWDNRTIVISGGYYDVTPTGRRWLGPGAILNRRAHHFHRVELEPGIQPVTLFWHGPKINEWGFLSADGLKIPADQFLASKSN